MKSYQDVLVGQSAVTIPIKSASKPKINRRPSRKRPRYINQACPTYYTNDGCWRHHKVNCLYLHLPMFNFSQPMVVHQVDVCKWAYIGGVNDDISTSYTISTRDGIKFIATDGAAEQSMNLQIVQNSFRQWNRTVKYWRADSHFLFEGKGCGHIMKYMLQLKSALYSFAMLNKLLLPVELSMQLKQLLVILLRTYPKRIVRPICDDIFKL